MHDKRRFLRDYFLFSDEILKLYCSRSQTKVNNKTSACLFAFNQRPEIFVLVSKAQSQVGKLASSRANSLLVISG